jgi:hypothetical protein
MLRAAAFDDLKTIYLRSRFSKVLPADADDKNDGLAATCWSIQLLIFK